MEFGDKKKKEGEGYPVLVKDVDDDDELPVVLSVVDESHPSDLDVPLERLSKQQQQKQKQNKTG